MGPLEGSTTQRQNFYCYASQSVQSLQITFYVTFILNGKIRITVTFAVKDIELKHKNKVLLNCGSLSNVTLLTDTFPCN